MINPLYGDISDQARLHGVSREVAALVLVIEELQRIREELQRIREELRIIKERA